MRARSDWPDRQCCPGRRSIDANGTCRRGAHDPDRPRRDDVPVTTTAPCLEPCAAAGLTAPPPAAPRSCRSPDAAAGGGQAVGGVGWGGVRRCGGGAGHQRVDPHRSHHGCRDSKPRADATPATEPPGMASPHSRQRRATSVQDDRLTPDHGQLKLRLRPMREVGEQPSLPMDGDHLILLARRPRRQRVASRRGRGR